MYVKNATRKSFPIASGRKSVSGHRSSILEQEEDELGSRRKQWSKDSVDDRFIQTSRCALSERIKSPHTALNQSIARSERRQDGKTGHRGAGLEDWSVQSSGEGRRRHALVDSESSYYGTGSKPSEGNNKYDNLNGWAKNPRDRSNRGLKSGKVGKGKYSFDSAHPYLEYTGKRDAGRRIDSQNASTIVSRSSYVDEERSLRSAYKVYRPSTKSKAATHERTNSAEGTPLIKTELQNTKVVAKEDQGNRVLIRSVRRLARSSHQESPGSRGSERPKTGLRSGATQVDDTDPNSTIVGSNGRRVNSVKAECNRSSWEAKAPIRVTSKRCLQGVSEG